MRTFKYVEEGALNKARDAWLDTIRRSVAPRPKLRLDPERAALLIVDMQRYFVSPDGRCFLPAAHAMVPRLGVLIGEWRSLGRPVFYTRHGHRGEDDLGTLGRFFSDYIRAGEPESEIIGQLQPQQKDSIIEKNTYDAFLNTSLQKSLSQREVEQVVVAGVLTHMCCETTARSAFCRGFEVFIPVDGVASSTERLHLGSLLSMCDALAVATSVAEVTELCVARR